MSQLIQLIYCSAAKHLFTKAELAHLLARSRSNNQKNGVTGMLLYADGSFFQVLEGEPAAVDGLFETIKGDRRHRDVTLIIREPIARRAFGDWTMGYADITSSEVDELVGANDFFGKGESFTRMGQGRAKKLLSAFRQGRWRSKLSDTSASSLTMHMPALSQADAHASLPTRTGYTFAFQPIVNANSGTIFSYEALLRGVNSEPAERVLESIDDTEMHRFDEQSRILAIELAAHLGLSTRLNLNFLPRSVESSPTAISSILETAERCHLRTDQIVLEILEREIINDFDYFNAALDRYRGSGMVFAIDDFGSGYAGLNLLAEFQPDLIKLDMELVRGIAFKGPRQAIVRGIVRTCFDLGIDIIAEGVETEEEYRWLHGEGIALYQGRLFAGPAFEALPTAFELPQ
jgi:EAL domain-containing protein (putative c-di-GMP-specific phosphodiesterase class I)